MKLTRIKSTMMAGMLAASMILPGMTAMAAIPGQTTTAAQGALVKKTVTAAESGVTFSETFTFTFTQDGTFDSTGKGTGTDDSNVKANLVKADIAPVTIQVTQDKRMDTAGVNLDNLTTPGVYTYTVAETKGSTAGWTYATNTYKLRVYVENNGTKTLTVDAGTNDKKSVAEFVNVFTKDATFTLTKGVTDKDNQEPNNQTYKFTVTIKLDSATSAPQSYTYTVAGAQKTVTPGDNGTTVVEVELKDTESAVFTNIPAGAKVTTNEHDNPDNVASIATKTLVGETESSGSAAEVKDVLVDEKGSSVTYTNTWKEVTVTGVVTSIAPYVTLVVLAVAAVAAYMAMKRRVAK